MRRTNRESVNHVGSTGPSSTVSLNVVASGPNALALFGPGGAGVQVPGTSACTLGAPNFYSVNHSASDAQLERWQVPKYRYYRFAFTAGEAAGIANGYVVADVQLYDDSGNGNGCGNRLPDNETCRAAISCGHVNALDSSAQDGHYVLDPDGISNGTDPFPAYCDLENGSAWTLIYSFPRDYTVVTTSTIVTEPTTVATVVTTEVTGGVPFTQFPDQDETRPGIVRLASSKVSGLRAVSSQWRVTCNRAADWGAVPGHPAKGDDFFRAKFEHFDVLGFDGNKTCFRTEAINVRGFSATTTNRSGVCETEWAQLSASSNNGVAVPAHMDTNTTCGRCSCPQLCSQGWFGTQGDRFPSLSESTGGEENAFGHYRDCADDLHGDLAANGRACSDVMAIVGSIGRFSCSTPGQELYPLVPAGYGTVQDLCPVSCGSCSANFPTEKYNPAFACSASANATTDYWVGEFWDTDPGPPVDLPGSTFRLTKRGSTNMLSITDVHNPDGNVNHKLAHEAGPLGWVQSPYQWRMPYSVLPTEYDMATISVVREPDQTRPASVSPPSGYVISDGIAPHDFSTPASPGTLTGNGFVGADFSGAGLGTQPLVLTVDGSGAPITVSLTAAMSSAGDVV
eukprot:SAG31_NODE_168_length_21484_cov_21.524994_17_plen_623_part_01